MASPATSGGIVIFRKVLTGDDCDLEVDRLSVPPHARVYLENFCRRASIAWGPWLPGNFLLVSDEAGRKWLFDYDSGESTFRNTWGAFVVQNRLQPGHTLTLGGVVDIAAQSLWTRVDVPMASTPSNVTAGIQAEGVAADLPSPVAAPSPSTPRDALLGSGETELQLGPGGAELQVAPGGAELGPGDSELGPGDAELGPGGAELPHVDAGLTLGDAALAQGDAALAPGETELALGDADLAKLALGDASAGYAPGDAKEIVCFESASVEQRLQACSKNLDDAMQSLTDCDVDMLALLDKHKRLRVSLKNVRKELEQIMRDQESRTDPRKRRCYGLA